MLLRNVGADLSVVPLDEVLDFRAKNGQHYRAYARALREFMVTVAQTSPAERQRIREERRLEIQDYAADLRRVSRAAFGIRTATLLVSCGPAWTLGQAIRSERCLPGRAASGQALPTQGRNVTAYSYLLRARDLVEVSDCFGARMRCGAPYLFLRAGRHRSLSPGCHPWSTPGRPFDRRDHVPHEDHSPE